MLMYSPGIQRISGGLIEYIFGYQLKKRALLGKLRDDYHSTDRQKFAVT
jgi:hypothetical protein